MGRPPKQIDAERVKALAQMQASHDEIAKTLGLNRSTLERHFAPQIKEWRSQGLETIRYYQWRAMKNGSAHMALKLGELYIPEQHPKYKEIPYETQQPQISVQRIDPAEAEVHSDARVLEQVSIQETGSDETSFPL